MKNRNGQESKGSPVGKGLTMTALVPGNANEFIEQQLDERICEIEDYFNSDALSFAGPIFDGVDNLLRIAIEQMRAVSKRRRLTVVLTTKGGYIEVVRRIVDTMRTHYAIVDFVIPDYAYSAGTVLALSGNSIYMDYYSRLGPIDPQVGTPISLGESGGTMISCGITCSREVVGA